MKSKITKVQTIKKGMVLILMLAILLPSTIYATEGLTLQASSALEKLMYGEVGSQVKKIEEHFKSNTTLYLTNEIQLRALAEYVNNGNSCYGKRIELLNNIEINPDIDWTPIGNSYSEFSGTFDGNGYTINNLTYLCRENYVTEGGYSNVGLFGVVSINGTVEKVNVNNSNIQANELDTLAIFKVGNIAGENYGRIIDCTADVMPLNIVEVAEGTLENSYIGLLVGKNNGSIENTNETTPSTSINLGSTKIDISAYKNEEKIDDFTIPTYIKIGETLRLEFVMDTYLYTGLEDGKAIKLADDGENKADIKTYPLVTIGSCKFTPVEAIQEEIEADENTIKPQTTLVYECTVIDEEDVKAENDAVCIDFQKNIDEENLYVYFSDDSENFFTGDKINEKAECSNLELNIDSKLPEVEIEVSMEGQSKSGRYAEGKELVIKVKTTEKIQATVAPELMVSFSESGIGKYNYQEYYTKGNAVHVDAILDGEGKTTWIYSYIIQLGDEGILNIEYISGTLTDLVGNSVNIIGQAHDIEEIYADTTAPKVQISAKDIVNSITNKDTITYEFKWSEQIEDFTADDITVNNGTKGELIKIYNITSNNIVANGDINGDTNITELDVVELEKLIDQNEEVDKKYDFNEDGIVNLEDVKDLITYSSSKIVEDKICKYTMDVTTSIQNGNVGELQIIIEDSACQDLVGHGNVRSEGIIRVDKKAPVLSSLEAYVESETKLNSQIDAVKEYYRTGEKIVVVATFDENVRAEKVSELILKFSESGNSVLPEGTIEGNKIIYTYVIKDGDKGTVSVRAFSGTVTDAAGNETNVTRKTLDGNTIIVDTNEPKVQLNVTTPKGIYGVGKEIIIEAQYDEDIYVLDNNEIKLIDTMIEVETTEEGEKVFTDNAPVLKIEFVDGVEREAKATGYGTKEDGSVDRTKIIYKYTVISGDNGELSIVSYTNRENLEICDIAGNVSDNQFDVKTYGVIADTIKPKVENITAVVESPSISNTGIYYKAGNKIDITIEFAEEVSGAVLFPEILIGFSEEEGKEPAELEYNTYAYESDWNVNTTTIKYSYTIQDGENGYLWVKVPTGQFKDAAGNKNDEESGREVLNIFADTTKPDLATNTNSASQWDIDYVTNDDGQVVGIKAEGTFSEKIFSMENNRLIELKDLPEMGIFIDRELKKTVKVSSITTTEDQTKLTYQTDVTEEIDKSGRLSVNLISGTVYDRAGNKWTLELEGDTSSPVFKDIKVLTSNGFYKSEKVIEIIARFEEETKLAKVPTLKVKIGEKVVDLEGVYYSEDSENTDNIKVARYAYEITDTDNGALNIISLVGEASDGVRGKNISQIYIDITEDDKEDVNAKAEELLNSYGNKYSNTQEDYKNVIADNIKPYVEKVEVYSKNELIAKYTKEYGKDAITEILKKTNANEVEYVITASEPINGFDNTKLLITNGIINEQDITTETSTTIKVKANTTIEGVQSLIISNNAADDRAGNYNELERFNLVTTDFTKPTVRFISEYNGGVYVLPTNIGKVEIRPNVEISEDISSIEYKWDNSEYSIIEDYSSSSDISVPTKAFTEVGTHVLSIKVIDTAGNVTETSKTYKVLESAINIELSTDDYTNQDVTATVSFEEGLTDNRKVKFKSENSREVVELNAAGVNENGDIEYIIEENGTIYAEATDKVGNKVFSEENVDNIDKVAPEVELTLNGANLVIGTEKGTATMATTVNVSEAVIIKYAWYSNITPDDEITEELSISESDITSLDLTNNGIEGSWYLKIIAIDKAGNETEFTSLPFTVTNSNIVKDEDGNVIFTPATEDIITFTREQQYVYPTYGMNLTENKKISFINEEDGYVVNGYAQVLKPTTVTAKASDVCGNTVVATFNVESVEGPEFEITGNPKEWTNQDVKLEVYSYDELKALTANGVDILNSKEYDVNEKGKYEFVATDIFGNISKQTIEVTKIDKDIPVITEVKSNGKEITITSTDIVNEVIGSDIAAYAITKTTELPVEWSKSNVIKTTEDGTFYVWVKDNAGNIGMSENTITVDTTAPVITFNYTVSTITAGLPIEATILINEEAILSYSWNNDEMITSEDYISNIKITKDSKEVGKYTLFVKATDKAGNASDVQKLEFNVVHVEEILNPEIIFEDIPIIQINGVKYVKINVDVTTETLTEKMNKEALCGKVPEYTNLAEENNLKTGSEIKLNGDTKYVVVVNGDINSDGEIDFIKDIIRANNYRLGIIKLSVPQILAADVNNDGKIEFIQDIISINNYRLGLIKSL